MKGNVGMSCHGEQEHAYTASLVQKLIKTIAVFSVSMQACLNNLVTGLKGKAKQTSQLHPGRSFQATQTNQLHPGQLFLFKLRRRAALGGIRTHDSLQSRRPLYQQSYLGNSAGRSLNLQHTTTQRQTTTLLWHSILSLRMQEQTGVIKPLDSKLRIMYVSTTW